MQKLTFSFIFALVSFAAFSQPINPTLPDPNPPTEIPGMKLVWDDEFNSNGKPNPDFWKYEKGFVRNEELQWYQEENATCSNSALIIEGRREEIQNPKFKVGSQDWRANRETAHYTSASINTRGQKQWLYGRFEIRARIDTAMGSWPAIWTLGVAKQWPSNGEIDLMEFYRVNNVPTILANVAWGTDKQYVAKWDTERIPFAHFLAKDPECTKKFHIWRMDWTKESIKLYLDDELLNTTLLSETINPDGFNPFTQPHYLLLNLALGGNGGNPDRSKFPIKYEVDYVRVYQEK
ncbi:laminarinase [Aquipluma nitroreducens]|uniref:Laminarinase n=1 Tax=Aquipluma nitroreducens TaxID=2010828 RepID=A0A5K7SCI5_9BACT|nr:glycoside hydrolase family 16 protein [Aquipluma nitroreducens]BBE19179.1 laminarinase [Aquipluma nitroreducens]